MTNLKFDFIEGKRVCSIIGPTVNLTSEELQLLGDKLTQAALSLRAIETSTALRFTSKAR